MKKLLLITITCFRSATVFAQTDGTVVEEKSSDWVKVTTVTTPVTTTPRRTSTTSNTSAPASNRTATRPTTSRPAATTAAPQKTATPPKPAESFDKTNQKVKRFKKT